MSRKKNENALEAYKAARKAYEEAATKSAATQKDYEEVLAKSKDDFWSICRALFEAHEGLQSFGWEREVDDWPYPEWRPRWVCTCDECDPDLMEEEEEDEEETYYIDIDAPIINGVKVDDSTGEPLWDSVARFLLHFQSELEDRSLGQEGVVSITREEAYAKSPSRWDLFLKRKANEDAASSLRWKAESLRDSVKRAFWEACRQFFRDNDELKKMTLSVESSDVKVSGEKGELLNGGIFAIFRSEDIMSLYDTDVINIQKKGLSLKMPDGKAVHV